MKANQNFSAIYILLAIAQMVICNYFRISPYISVTVLPAMVLCIPLQIYRVGRRSVLPRLGLSKGVYVGLCSILRDFYSRGYPRFEKEGEGTCLVSHSESLNTSGEKKETV